MIALSLVFVNKSDELFNYSALIEEIEEYDTVVCHGSEYSVYIYTYQELELEFTAERFAERIINATAYSGKDIRLMACNTGSKDDGFAQQLANVLGVKVLAPTEAIWVNSYGDVFISDYDVLAQMWYEGKKVNETGTWREFLPQKGVADD